MLRPLQSLTNLTPQSLVPPCYPPQFCAFDTFSLVPEVREITIVDVRGRHPVELFRTTTLRAANAQRAEGRSHDALAR